MDNNEYWSGAPAAGSGPAVDPAAAAPAAAAPSVAAPEFQGEAFPAAAPSPAAAAAAAVPSKPKSRGWIVGIVVVVCICALLAFGVHSCNSMLSNLGGGAGSWGDFDIDDLNEDTVAVINISGTIQYDGSACSPEGLKQLLDEAEGSSHIKAVVLRVDSGGGTATAGEEMAEYVRQFSEKKPIVVSSASINASAAYEISSQADYIFVARSTEIGAIGTAMQLTDLSGLLEMLGVNMDVIASAEQKDSSYGFRPLTEEERAYYQDMVDQINEVFIENVAAGRDMSLDEVRALATGMPFTGVTAVENGLADEIGTREDAVAKAAELAGIEGDDYATTTLTFSTYDLSGLAYLLGMEDRTSVDELALLTDALSSEGGVGHVVAIG